VVEKEDLPAPAKDKWFTITVFEKMSGARPPKGALLASLFLSLRFGMFEREEQIDFLKSIGLDDLARQYDRGKAHGVAGPIYYVQAVELRHPVESKAEKGGHARHR
jgi:hypothetical protein